MISRSVRRGSALASQLGLSDRLRATPADRDFFRSLEAGLDEIENLAPKLRWITRSCHSYLLMSDTRIQESQPRRTRGTQRGRCRW